MDFFGLICVTITIFTLGRYLALKEVLKQRIISGVYPENRLLPSEMDLSLEFEVNRHTIRHALEVLAAEGYITKHKGKGSMVKRVRPSLGLLSFTGFSEVLRSADFEVSTKILKGPELREWPIGFFTTLSDEEKYGGCIYLKRLRMANGEPILLEKTFLPAKYISLTPETTLIGGSLFETLLKTFGLEIRDLKQEIKAILPDENAFRLLKLRKKIPLLYIRRKYVTSQPGVFVYSELYMNTSNFSISNMA